MSSDFLSRHNGQLSDASLCIVSTLTWQQRLTGYCKKKQVFNISVRVEGSDALTAERTDGSIVKIRLETKRKCLDLQGGSGKSVSIDEA